MSGGRPSERAEFALALECCRSGFRSAREPAGTVPEAIDWSRFLNLVRFHRIEGLAAAFIAENKTAVPPDLVTNLTERAAQIAARNLEAAADSGNCWRRSTRKACRCSSSRA